MAGAVMGKPFWKYEQPERFVQWGEDAVEQLIQEGYRRVAYFFKNLKKFEKFEKFKKNSKN